MSEAKSEAKSEHGLVRAMGALGLAAGVVNMTVGGGIFRLPSEVASDLGAAAPIAFLICAVVIAMIGLTIVQAGSRVSTTGGPYTYVEIAFGPYAGFMTGVMTWLIGVTAMAAIGDVFISNVAGFVPVLASPTGRILGLLTVFGFMTVVNVLGVQYGARLNSLTTILKLVPLLILVALGFFAIEPANLVVADMPSAATVTRTSMVLLFAFTGVEFALVPGGEIKDPSRTVPRGILLGLGGVTVLYLAIQLVAQGVLGPALAGSTTPLADAAGAALGPWGRTLLLVGVIVSTFGYLSGMCLASPRSLYALARDGYLPRAMASVHPRFHTPWISVIVQIAICFILAVWSDFGPLALISNVAALLVYFACAAGAWELKRRGIQDPGTTPYAMPGGAIIPVLSCIAILGLLTSITPSEWLVLLEVAAVATVIFFATKASRSRLRTAD